MWRHCDFHAGMEKLLCQGFDLEQLDVGVLSDAARDLAAIAQLAIASTLFRWLSSVLLPAGRKWALLLGMLCTFYVQLLLGRQPLASLTSISYDILTDAA